MLELEVPRGCSGGDEVDFMSSERRMSVEVPAGLSPGDKFVVAIPHQLTVVVPEGVHAGEEISVECDDGETTFLVKVPDGLVAGMEFMVDGPSARRELDGVRTKLIEEEPTGSFSLRRSGSPSSDDSSTEPSAGTNDDASNSASADTAKGVRLHAAEELRVPSPEPGREFYIGQHVLMPRKGGGASNGVVLDIIDGFETLYRCRIGDSNTGSLEKYCTEDEIRPSTPPPGFEFFVGQMVRVTRRTADGRAALATVLKATFVRDGDDDEGEAGYELRIEADPLAMEDAAASPVFELRTEDELRILTSTAPGSAFFVGQLVQVRGADGGFEQLARVFDVHRAADADGVTRLAYACRYVRDGWGFGD